MSDFDEQVKRIDAECPDSADRKEREVRTYQEKIDVKNFAERYEALAKQLPDDILPTDLRYLGSAKQKLEYKKSYACRQLILKEGV